MSFPFLPHRTLSATCLNTAHAEGNLLGGSRRLRASPVLASNHPLDDLPLRGSARTPEVFLRETIEDYQEIDFVAFSSEPLCHAHARLGVTPSHPYSPTAHVQFFSINYGGFCFD